MGQKRGDLVHQWKALLILEAGGTVNAVSALDSCTSISQLKLPILLQTDAKGKVRFLLWSSDEKSCFQFREVSDRLWIPNLIHRTVYTANWISNPDFITEEVILDGRLVSYYHGAMKGGKRNGHGTSDISYGGRFAGNWRNGALINGATVEPPPVDGVYTGWFENNKKHGAGRFSSANGDFLDGNMSEFFGHKESSRMNRNRLRNRYIGEFL
eukprot:gene46316-57761_t